MAPKKTATTEEKAAYALLTGQDKRHDIRTMDFVSDAHAPHQQDECIALAAAYIKDHQQGTKGVLVMGGDMCEAYTVQTKYRRLGTGTHTLEQEILATREHVIKPFCAAAPKADKWYIEGNHEFRMKRAIAFQAPFFENLKGLRSFGEAMELDEFGIKYVESKNGNGILRMTPFLTFMHGERHGVNAAKTQYEAWGTSVIFGHTHKQTTYTKKWGCGREDISMSAGCLSKDPDYRDIDDYTRGFVSGWVNFSTGEFFAAHVPIVRTKTGGWVLYSGQGNYRAMLDAKSRKWKVEHIKNDYQK